MSEIRCCDCRDGEHPNYDSDVILCIVRDPETGHLTKRGRLCRNHRQAYLEDGYDVHEKEISAEEIAYRRRGKACF